MNDGAGEASCCSSEAADALCGSGGSGWLDMLCSLAILESPRVVGTQGKFKRPLH